MFENMTDEELIAKNVYLKQEQEVIHAQRKELADELRRRDLVRGTATRLASMGEGEKAALKEALNSGNVVVTPPPAVIRATPTPTVTIATAVATPVIVAETEEAKKKSFWDRIRGK